MTQLEEYISNGTWLSKMTDQAAWGLIDLLQDLGTDITGIEIGVQLGINSYMLLDACPNIKKITGIDPYEPYADWNRYISQQDQDASYAIFCQNRKLLGNRFELIKAKSSEVYESLPDESFDFVFIDGDHSIREVLNDLENYMPKVKKGGILAGHDIGLHSVNMALRSWCKRKFISTSDIHIIENQAWYWIKE